MSELPDHLDPTGQTCSDCDHAAYAPFQPFAGRYYGFKCVCCFRKMWEETQRNVTESLAELPEECS